MTRCNECFTKHKYLNSGWSLRGWYLNDKKGFNQSENLTNKSRLTRLVVQNRIVKDLDSKPFGFDRRLQFKSDSNDGFD